MGQAGYLVLEVGLVEINVDFGARDDQIELVANKFFKVRPR